MTTPNVTEIKSTRRTAPDTYCGLPKCAACRHYHAADPGCGHPQPRDDDRRRCAEIRELDRRADIARVTS